MLKEKKPKQNGTLEKFGTYTYANIKDLAALCTSYRQEQRKYKWIAATVSPYSESNRTEESHQWKNKTIILRTFLFAVVAKSDSKAVDRLALIYS